ncbi:MAG: HDOD domain-containing protein [Burkholderiales bacterium]|nr:HDOD domain-containing protein [Burkholderiales bacterium]
MNTPTTTIPTFDQIVRKIQFDEIVKQVQDLPSLPAVVMELLNSIDQEDIDISVLAQKVTLDQALTAKTLRFANSSLYGTPTKATTIQQAITILGVQSVRNLITAAAMTGCFPKGKINFFDFKAFWRHSIATATCANILAKHLRKNQDFAFTAGLLHDIGRLVLVTRFPEHYEGALAYRAQHDCYLIDAERAVLDIDHVVAGHALASHWNFSDVLQKAIAGHHEPEKMPDDSLTAIVHVADAITHALDLSATDDDLVPPVCMIAWKKLGMDEKVCKHVFKQTIEQFEGINRLLA